MKIGLTMEEFGEWLKPKAMEAMWKHLKDRESAKYKLTNGDEVYVYNLLAKFHPVKYIGDYKGDGLSSVVELSDGTFDTFDTAAIFKGSLDDRNNHVNLATDYHRRFKEMMEEYKEII
jgi:hypothetical protein